jgi:uncharacterized protein YjiS (DUF1127 family)
MSVATQTNDHPKSVRRLVHWWRDWIRRRAAAAELDRFGQAGVERLAQDLAMGRADLRILAGKWPTHLNLLSRRMEELDLDGAEIARVKPEVARDLQRVCSLCASQRKCRHDLVRNPSAPAWQAYCPNAARSPPSSLSAPSADARRLRMSPEYCIRTGSTAVAVAVFLLSASDSALAESPMERRGLRFVRLHGAQCHAMDKVGESPLAMAPPFRTLHLKYPVADLQPPLVPA